MENLGGGATSADYQAAAQAFPQAPPQAQQGDPRLRFVGQFGQEIGNRGLLAWDLGRALAVAGWGALAGFCSEEEAWGAILPSAERIRGAYGSWEEYAHHYRLGALFWNPDAVGDVDRALAQLNAAPDNPWRAVPWRLDPNAAGAAAPAGYGAPPPAAPAGFGAPPPAAGGFGAPPPAGGAPAAPSYGGVPVVSAPPGGAPGMGPSPSNYSGVPVIAATPGGPPPGFGGPPMGGPAGGMPGAAPGAAGKGKGLIIGLAVGGVAVVGLVIGLAVHFHHSSAPAHEHEQSHEHEHEAKKEEGKKGKH
jgi:hypothetical protein